MTPASDGAIGIGFIGAGMVAELHAAAIGRSPSADLVGLFDNDPQVGHSRAAAWGCRSYPSLDELLADADIDAVYVLSPTAVHIEHARRVLESGRHVLVEKPVSRDPVDIAQLIALARLGQRVCMPGHNYAYIPEYQRIRRLVRDGSLGTVRLGAVMFAIGHSEEVASHYDGATWLVMPHHAYLMHGLLGMPASVTAGSTKPAWTHLAREDQSWIVLDYPPHGTAMLFTTLGADDDSADPWSFVIKVIGSAGSASASLRSAVLRRGIGSTSLGWASYEEAYERELAAFVDAIRGQPSAIASPMEDAIAVARIIAAAEASTARRRTVVLPPSSPRSRG